MFWLFLIAIILVILALIYISVPWAENKVLYFPSKKKHWKPDTDYHDVYITENKVKNRKPKNGKFIHGWHFDSFPGHKTVMFSHGNSGNISNRSYIIDICKKFELNLFLFDYNGFGQSSGEPNKLALKENGEMAYKYLVNHYGVNPKDLIIWGESLGGSTAIWTASKYPCRSLILLCTFSGLDDAVNNYFETSTAQSVATGFTTMASLRYDLIPSRDYIQHVKCPVVILHSVDDDIIPYQCAKILYENIKHESKELITIKGGHSSPIITVDQLYKMFMFCDIPLPKYKRADVEKLLKEVETVAERYHNFIDN